MLPSEPRLTTTSFSASVSLARAAGALDGDREQRAPLLDVAAVEHRGERAGHRGERDVGEEAEAALVDADQRNVVRRELPREREHGAVAAETIARSALRPGSARRCDGFGARRPPRTRPSRRRPRCDGRATRGMRRELARAAPRSRASLAARRGRCAGSGRVRSGHAAIKPHASPRRASSRPDDDAVRREGRAPRESADRMDRMLEHARSTCSRR